MFRFAINRPSLASPRLLSRRRFLSRTSATLAAAGSGLAGFHRDRCLASSTGGADAPQPVALDFDPGEGFVDAHSHIWTRDTEAFPLAPAVSVDDLLPPSFTAEELLAVVRPEGVTRVVLISHFRYYGFDNGYLIAMAKKYPGVFAVVGALDHTQPEIEARMVAAKKEGVTGYRIRPDRVRKGEADPDWLMHPGMREMWRAGAKHGIAMCPLITPESLPTLPPMFEACPDTTVVIDHFARVRNGMTAELDQLVAMARFPNVHIKVSAFYSHSETGPPYLDIGPKIERLLQAYGPERLLWASDLPYQLKEGNTYHDSIALVRSRLEFLTGTDREWLLKKTAEKVYFSGLSL